MSPQKTKDKELASTSNVLSILSQTKIISIQNPEGLQVSANVKDI
jgi:hypothetical protein